MKQIPLLVFIASLIAPITVMANDYPTTLRVEYVLQCMAANGNKPEMLYKRTRNVFNPTMDRNNKRRFKAAFIVEK